jgi:hypothetical protein
MKNTYQIIRFFLLLFLLSYTEQTFAQSNFGNASLIGGNVTVCGGDTVALSISFITPGSYSYSWTRSLATEPSTNIGTTNPVYITKSGTYKVLIHNNITGGDTLITTYVNVADYVFNGSITSSDAQQTGRLNRFGVTSTCVSPKSCPGTFTSTGNRAYDAYTVTNPYNTSVCATIGINSSCGTNVFSVVYSGSFNATSLCTNYLGDPGSSFIGAGFYEITIPPNGSIVATVHELNPGVGCADYSLTVDIPRETLAITVTPSATPCSATPVTMTASTANTYLWSPGAAATRNINVMPTTTSTNYNVILGYGNHGCTATATQTVVISTPTVNQPTNQIVCNGATTTVVSFSGTATSYNWTNSNMAIGLGGSSGLGNIASFTATNTTAVPVTSTITVTPTYTNSGVTCTGTPRIFTITVNPTPIATATPNPQTICNGSASNIILNANTPSAGNTYAWTAINGTGISGGAAGSGSNIAQTLNNSNSSQGFAAYTITPTYTNNGVSCTGAIIKDTVWVNSTVVPAVTIANTATSNTLCTGTSITFTATPTNGGSNPIYQWRKNGVNVGTNSTTYSDASLNNNDIISVRLTSNAACRSVDTINSAGATMLVNSIVVPSVSVTNTTTANTLCTGTNITFTATPANGGSTPVFQWRKNGVNIGTNSATYSDAGLNNNDVINVRLTSNATCRSVDTINSTGATMVVNPIVAPSVAVTNSATSNTLCAGANITFTATPTNGGAAPVYQWRKNGVNVGTNSATYSDASLSNNDVISVRLTSNAACRTIDTINSTNTTMTVNVVPNLTATPTSASICTGTATSIALSSSSTGATFAWTVTQSGVTGATTASGSTIAQTLTNATTTPGTATYTITPSLGSCSGIPTSVVVTVKPKPTVVIAPTTQSICTNTATNIVLSSAVSGTTYAWTVTQTNVSGANAGSGASIAQTLNATTNVAGTAVYTITPTAASCAGSNATATITVTPPPATPAAITGSVSPCVGSTQNYTIASVAGATNYLWTLPPGWSGTSTTATIAATIGSSVGMVTVAARNSCGSSSVSSINVNPLPMLVPSISITGDMPQLHCSGTLIHFVAAISNGGTSPVLQWKVNGINMGNNNVNFAYIPNDGDVITCVVNSNYPCVSNNNLVSNALTMNVTPTVNPSMNIYVEENHICSNIPVHFIGTPQYEGNNPSYQWKVNNNNVGSNTVNFTYTPNNGDEVICVLSSNAICASPTVINSNMVPMTIENSIHPSVSISASPQNSVTIGTPVTFTASLVDPGNNYQITWHKNGVNIAGAVGQTWTAVAGTDFGNNAEIGARFLSFSPCAEPDTATSNIIIMKVGTTGINNTKAPTDFNLYPNPSNGVVHIEGLHVNDEITIYDALGKKINHQQVNTEGVFDLDISPSAQGIYLLYFSNKENRQWKVKISKTN